MRPVSSSHPDVAFAHVHAMRLLSGDEVLIAQVRAVSGAVGLGFSFRLDAAEARHMAMRNAGIPMPHCPYSPVLDHPWEAAWTAILAGSPEAAIDWEAEPGFRALQWTQG